MSSVEARSSGDHKLENNGPFADIIDLTESDEEVWRDARQTPIAQRSIVAPEPDPRIVAGLRPAGGMGVMQSVEDPILEDVEMKDEHSPANAPLAQEERGFHRASEADQAPAQFIRPNAVFDVDADIWEDYVVNEDGELVAFAAEDGFLSRPPNPDPANNQPIPHAQSDPNPPMEDNSRDACITQLMSIFPGICLDHVSELYEKVAQTTDQLVAHILEQSDKGIKWPKKKDKERSNKRKRVLDEDEEAARKYGGNDRVVADIMGGTRPYVRTILMQEFGTTPAVFIDATLSQNNSRLFSAYRILEEAHRTYDDGEPPYNKIKTARKKNIDLSEAAVASIIGDPTDLDIKKIEVLEELQAARRLKRKGDVQRAAVAQKKLDEEQNVKQAELEGTMLECGCCCCDYPQNRMVHCDSEAELHWFCRNCARMTAEVEIGKSKYDLRCMSTDKCEAGFSMHQRDEFLDATTKVALERNEQEANLRLAGIENLASCPFCPYAAEYPPVEIDREFRCQAEDCERVSCRLCKLESHIPKSCDEFAKENGLSIRRQIEEAMSAALIRRCNKCNTPFIKDEGCNKMSCFRNGCGNIQCYVCSKSCGYDHFNDASRGGKTGNCPLFEQVEQRHEDEVKKAEKEALDKVLAEHPEYTAEDLKVHMSENVKLDDDKRKQKDPMRVRQDALMAAMRHGRPGGAIPFPVIPRGQDPGMARLEQRIMAEYELAMGRGRVGGPGQVMFDVPRALGEPGPGRGMFDIPRRLGGGPPVAAPGIAAPVGIVQAQIEKRARVRREREQRLAELEMERQQHLDELDQLEEEVNQRARVRREVGGREGRLDVLQGYEAYRAAELIRARALPSLVRAPQHSPRLSAMGAAIGNVNQLEGAVNLRRHLLDRAPHSREARSAVPEPLPRDRVMDRVRERRERREREQDAADDAESLALIDAINRRSRVREQAAADHPASDAAADRRRRAREWLAQDPPVPVVPHIPVAVPRVPGAIPPRMPVARPRSPLTRPRSPLARPRLPIIQPPGQVGRHALARRQAPVTPPLEPFNGERRVRFDPRAPAFNPHRAAPVGAPVAAPALEAVARAGIRPNGMGLDFGKSLGGLRMDPLGLDEDDDGDSDSDDWQADWMFGHDDEDLY